MRSDKTCPVCDKPSEAPYAPFCSDRCKTVDLNRWLQGAYVISHDESEQKSMDSPARVDDSRSNTRLKTH
ncbi:MAG: DNA gyrase inhibitor YacG [Pseudomonadota bacterium]